MSKRILKPEDVPEVEAKRVLDFLNAARTAEEIAGAIEIPEERDVGLRVAQNILEDRARIGRFRNLGQVFQVRQVGPERFTEIVNTLKDRVIVRRVPVERAVVVHTTPICEEKAPSLPVNVRPVGEKPEYSGFIIVRLSEPPVAEIDDLRELAKEYNLQGLSRLLDEYKQVKSRRQIHSLPPSELLKLEREALASKFPPLHSLTAYWRLDCRGLPEIEKLLDALNELSEVDLAYRELSVSDPVVNDADDPHATGQDYLDAAPTGIDARWAWTQPNGEGAGVALIDLEQGWFPNHEDLIATTPTLIFNDNRDGVGGYKGNHGTAVLGEAVGVDNTVGIVGIAPAVTSVRMVSHYEAATDTALHVADAIVAAIGAMAVGDVLLLEVQRSFLPTETDGVDFDAIRLAVAHGIIVVEAAGNGNMDLDAWVNASGQTILNRGSLQFLDSGAIMVGASLSALDATGAAHDRWGFSNFGSRIDCYGWGENIVTAGYGDLDPGTGDNSTYTDTFGGTSGASPMIVGAAIILQGMYQATTGTRLSPGQMRALLSNPATGTPQGAGVAGNISVMPDLSAIIQNTLGLVPDIYLRDMVGDTGVIPSIGTISSSPDVIVTPTAAADPTASFGEGSGTENSSTLGYEVEAGQDNFIYVRMRNRGAAPANGTVATVYWSQVATLVTPDMWTLIGTSTPVNVPVGDTLVVTDPITWSAASIPGTGHYCFIVTLDHPQDPAPPPPANDLGAFMAYIRNHNNVTWRNFNVVDVVPDPSADPAELPFLVAGAPDRARVFNLEIQQRLPEDAVVWWEVPLGLLGALPRDRFAEVKVDRKRKLAMLRLPRLRSVPLCAVRLGRSARHQCRFLIQGSKGLKNGWHSVSIRQIFKDEEVGRVTWALRAAEKRG